MTKLKMVILSLSILLILSLAANWRLCVLWLSSHDDVYEMINEAYLNDQKVLSEIESGRVSNAVEILRHSIEVKGNIIAICAIEKCAESIVGAGNEKP